MKTTIDISDPLLAAAKSIAAREGTTLRELVEAGLRLAVAERRRPGRFKLRRASVKGRGMRPELREAGWDAIRRAAYGDRGG
jgi:hypothetical protein